jgi:hypothetical protein
MGSEKAAVDGSTFAASTRSFGEFDRAPVNLAA